MTKLLFRDDAYQQTTSAKLLRQTSEGGLILDQSIFYGTAGGQPGDKGEIDTPHGTFPIITTVYDADKNLVHMPETPLPPMAPGTPLTLRLDWAQRYHNMRIHTLMHLLCASVPFPVTGSAISHDGGRIDFDIPEGQIPNKQELSDKLNALITADHEVSQRWISDEEMQANLHLVRTMSVKPPMGTGWVRLVMIGSEGQTDIQPCGGTHVKSTAEIGPVAVVKIESKGKINRRIRVALMEL